MPPERIANRRPLAHWRLAMPHVAIVYVLGTEVLVARDPPALVVT
jgi:hypothetical protein